MQKTTNYYSTAEDIAFSPLNYWDQPKAFTHALLQWALSIINIYTLSDVDVLSNLIGSLSWTLQPQFISISKNKMLIHIRIRSSQQSVNTVTLEDVTKAKTTVNPWPRLDVVGHFMLSYMNQIKLKTVLNRSGEWHVRSVCNRIDKSVSWWFKCCVLSSTRIKSLYIEKGAGLFNSEKTMVSVLRTETY